MSEEQFVEMTFSLCLGFQMVLRIVVLDRVGRSLRYQYFKLLNLVILRVPKAMSTDDDDDLEPLFHQR